MGLTPIYRGSDPELAMSCKRMVKKDITTKLKSFNEVILLLQERSHLIHEFLPYFTYIFPRMFMDNDRKIREQLFVLLMTIVSLDKQTLTPYMKHLIGYWYIGTVDPCIEVRAMALSSLEKARPPRKREPVLLYLSTSLLRQIRYFLDQKPETLSDMSHTSQEDAMERYERIYISTIASISKLTSLLFKFSSSFNSRSVCIKGDSAFAYCLCLVSELSTIAELIGGFSKLSGSIIPC